MLDRDSGDLVEIERDKQAYTGFAWIQAPHAAVIKEQSANPVILEEMGALVRTHGGAQLAEDRLALETKGGNKPDVSPWLERCFSWGQKLI